LKGGIRWKYINPFLHKNGSKYPGLVCIFPEGKSGLFQQRQILHKFFPGVFQIATKYKIPIVPVATFGFQKAVPLLKNFEREHSPPFPEIGSIIPFPFKLKIEFGEAFELDNFYDKTLTKKEEWWIANHIIRSKVAALRSKYT